MRSKRRVDSRSRKKTKRVYGGAPEYILEFGKYGPINIRQNQIGRLTNNIKQTLFKQKDPNIPFFISWLDMNYGVKKGTLPNTLYKLKPQTPNSKAISTYINSSLSPISLGMDNSIKTQILNYVIGNPGSAKESNAPVVVSNDVVPSREQSYANDTGTVNQKADIAVDQATEQIIEQLLQEFVGKITDETIQKITNKVIEELTKQTVGEITTDAVKKIITDAVVNEVLTRGSDEDSPRVPSEVSAKVPSEVSPRVPDAVIEQILEKIIEELINKSVSEESTKFKEIVDECNKKVPGCYDRLKEMIRRILSNFSSSKGGKYRKSNRRKPRKQKTRPTKRRHTK